MLNDTLYSTVKKNLNETLACFITFENCINEKCTTLKAKIVKHSENNFSYSLIGISYVKKGKVIKSLNKKENVTTKDLKDFLDTIIYYGNISTVSYYESHY